MRRVFVFTAPTGTVICLVANVQIAGLGATEHVIKLLDPGGFLVGLSWLI
jgi:hypothetical protein